MANSTVLSKPKMVLFLTAIFLCTIISQHDAVILPIAGALYEAFPTELVAVNWILSGPSLLFLFASLLVPFVCKVLSRKMTLVITCIVFSVSCIAAIFVNNLWLMVVYRTIGGICIGFQQVVSVDIITAYFTDDKKRATFVGIYNACQAAMGTVLSLISGFLALNGWEQVYNVFWAMIPITLLVIFFVPDIKFEGDEKSEENGKKVRHSMGKNFWTSAVILFVFCIMYAPLFFLAAVYVTEFNLGDEAYAGLIAAAGQLAAMLISLVFGLIYAKARKRCGLIALVGMTVSLLAAFLVHDSTVFLIADILGGASYGIMMAYLYSHMPSIVAPESRTKAISYVTAVQAFGFFVCTYIASFVSDAVGGLGMTSLIFGIIGVVLIVVEVFNIRTMKPYGDEEAAETEAA